MTNELTLLYVEDDDVVRENFSEIFSTYFPNILLASNGPDALKMFYNNAIDIIILDVSLPGINGLNVASEIRKQNANVEIIMLTAYSEKDKLIQALNFQVFSYLVKPVKHEELDKTLTSLIQKIYFKNILNLQHNYSFDYEQKTLYYKTQKVTLTKNEKKLIAHLCQHKTLHHSACDIANNLFPDTESSDAACNNIIQLISRFKKKMTSTYDEENFFIDNIYGLGYKILC